MVSAPVVQLNEASDASSAPLEVASLRAEGNDAFRAKKYSQAVKLYTKSVDDQEQDWILALSNRAICHNCLEKYKEALQDAERVLSLLPESDKTFTKAAHTLCIASLGLASQYVDSLHWAKAFAFLRRLFDPKVFDKLVKKTQDELLESECKWRDLRIQLIQTRCKVNFDDYKKPTSSTLNADNLIDAQSDLEAKSFNQALEFGLQSLNRTMDGVSGIHVVGARYGNECPVALSKLFTEPKANLLMIGPQVETHETCPDTLPGFVTTESSEVRVRYAAERYQDYYDDNEHILRPDVAVVFCASLDSEFASWGPAIRILIEEGVLTFVTGYGHDQSLIQNEDILETLNAKIVLPTTLIPNPVRFPYANGMSTARNYHICAFQGFRTPEEDLPDSVVFTRGRQLMERGFEIRM